MICAYLFEELLKGIKDIVVTHEKDSSAEERPSRS